jgi:hypothetical protein
LQKYGDELLDIQLPDQVVAELVDADEAVQGDTVSAIQKNA